MSDSIWAYVLSPTSAFAGLFTYFTLKFFANSFKCQKNSHVDNPSPPVFEFSEEELDAISSAIAGVGSVEEPLELKEPAEEEPDSVSAPPEVPMELEVSSVQESSSTTEQDVATTGFLENRRPKGTLDLNAIRGLSIFSSDFSFES
jgi:hypothetical protein